MGYFDENEEKEGISALADGMSEKERRREEKRLEKERRKAEKEAEKKALKAGESLLGAAGKPEASAEKQETPQDGSYRPGDLNEKPETGAEGSEEKSDSAILAEAAEEETKKKKKRRKKKGSDEKPEDVNIVKDLLTLIIYIGIVILICFLIVTFVGRRTTVHGSSMEPTLQSGDSLWINMLAYKFGDPERYDIIVFPYEDDVHYIKRIIGLPGETVQISENGDISINGELLKEPIKFDTIQNNGIASNPITLGPDEYFVLGDNRNNSRDSRWSDVGNIKRDKIVGKAVFRLTPLKKFGSIK